MSSRAVLVPLVVSVAAVTAFACGGGSKPPSDPTAASASAEPSAAPSASTQATAAASASAAPTASAAPSASTAAVVDACAEASAPFEAKVRPDVKKCFFDAMAKRPDLDGHIHITLAVDPKGKAGNVLIANDKILGKETVTCMTNAVKAGAFDGSACAGKSIVMNMAFGNAARN